MIDSVEIAGRPIGRGCPCFVIAEAGVNHNGDVHLGLRLVDVAADAGADAVKFQTFRADRVVSPLAPKAAYQTANTGSAGTQLEMVRKLELSAADHRILADQCRKRGILFLSTPFDEPSVDLLSDLGVPAFKVPSGEITNYPLLAYVARKKRPLIISTGMSTLDEVRRAVQVVREEGVDEIILLQCVSSYPANPRDVNLRAMQTMRDEFGVPVGYSDHTLGVEVALAAVALGACVIEKHLTLDRTLPGPDHQMSADPAELTALVSGIRKVESAMGDGRKKTATSEAEIAAVARRSLIAEIDVPAGTQLTESMIGIKRPGTGLPPEMLSEIIGRKALRDIPSGTAISWDMLA